ncbi:MAG: hypothetical protein KY468_05525 [Armatimonadetes bacterium]|nr:hypothetical protein [Armatimonadota bacterium]
MDESIQFDADADPTDDFRSAISHVIAQIEQNRHQMRKDQAEIDQLRADIDALKAESKSLREETLLLLNDLKAAA